MAILIAALRNGAARVVPRGLLLGGQAGAADLPAPAAGAGEALFPRGACRDGEEPEKGRGTSYGGNQDHYSESRFLCPSFWEGGAEFP